MAKISNKSANGTSFHGTTIRTTVHLLKTKFGQPEWEDNTGEDKTNFDWVGETKDGDVFTIYDWKEYRAISEHETIDFHIGGSSQYITSTAKQELKKLING